MGKYFLYGLDHIESYNKELKYLQGQICMQEEESELIDKQFLKWNHYPQWSKYNPEKGGNVPEQGEDYQVILYNSDVIIEKIGFSGIISDLAKDTFYKIEIKIKGPNEEKTAGLIKKIYKDYKLLKEK